MSCAPKLREELTSENSFLTHTNCAGIPGLDSFSLSFVFLSPYFPPSHYCTYEVRLLCRVPLLRRPGSLLKQVKPDANLEGWTLAKWRWEGTQGTDCRGMQKSTTTADTDLKHSFRKDRANQDEAMRHSTKHEKSSSNMREPQRCLWLG